MEAFLVVEEVVPGMVEVTVVAACLHVARTGVQEVMKVRSGVQVWAGTAVLLGEGVEIWGFLDWVVDREVLCCEVVSVRLGDGVEV